MAPSTRGRRPSQSLFGGMCLFTCQSVSQRLLLLWHSPQQKVASCRKVWKGFALQFCSSTAHQLKIMELIRLLSRMFQKLCLPFNCAIPGTRPGLATLGPELVCAFLSSFSVGSGPPPAELDPGMNSCNVRGYRTGKIDSRIEFANIALGW